MPESLAREHYRALSGLSVLVDRDLRSTWERVAGNVSALIELVPAVGDVYGEMAAALAMDFYEESREQAEARGRFVAEPADLPDEGRYAKLVNWALTLPDPVANAAGELQKIVANVARDTVATNSVRDPAAAGWKRVTRAAGGCDFCRMLASRGAVYKDSTVRFSSHGHCHCVASPAFSGGPDLTVVQYKASVRTPSAADRQRVRDYLRPDASR